MTPEQRAADILERCWERDPEKVSRPGYFLGLDVEIANAITAAAAEATARERDACLKIAQASLYREPESLVTDRAWIVRKIRERGQSPGTPPA